MQTLTTSKWRIPLVLAAAAALTAGLILASKLGSDSPGTAPPVAAAPPTTSVPADEPVARRRAFPGIPQHGAALGSPTAPVTLVEYADLQCPYCAQWARETLPVLVDEYVRTGRVRIVFRGLSFVGPDSQTALEAVVAAGRQDRMWDVLESLYGSQGAENSGWVTEQLLADVAAAVPGLDAARLDADRDAGSTARDIAKAARAASAAGVNGTPSFEVGPTGGHLQLVKLSSLGPEALRPAIEAAAR